MKLKLKIISILFSHSFLKQNTEIIIRSPVVVKSNLIETRYHINVRQSGPLFMPPHPSRQRLNCFGGSVTVPRDASRHVSYLTCDNSLAILAMVCFTHNGSFRQYIVYIIWETTYIYIYFNRFYWKQWQLVHWPVSFLNFRYSVLVFFNIVWLNVENVAKIHLKLICLYVSYWTFRT